MSELKDSGLEQLNEILNSGYRAGKTVSKKGEKCKECEHIKVTTKADLEEKCDLVPLGVVDEQEKGIPVKTSLKDVEKKIDSLLKEFYRFGRKGRKEIIKVIIESYTSRFTIKMGGKFGSGKSTLARLIKELGKDFEILEETEAGSLGLFRQPVKKEEEAEKLIQQGKSVILIDVLTDVEFESVSRYMNEIVCFSLSKNPFKRQTNKHKGWFSDIFSEENQVTLNLVRKSIENIFKEEEI